MSLSRIVPRAAFGALTLGAAFTLAAPLLPFAQSAQAGEGKEETTVTISTSKDKEATVLKLEPMKAGETKTVTSEAGKPVTVTRTEDGYTIKTGEREIKVKTMSDGEGPHILLPGGKEVHVVKGHHCGDGDDVNMVFTGDDGKTVMVKKHAYAYKTGDDGPKATAADVLKKAAPKSIESLDRPTRDAVERVLQEMLDKGVVFAPGAMPMLWDAKEDGDGERVKVMVIQEKKDDGAKK
ncbi:MAG TPA: hypothetical protein VE129_19090 [Thermoanaerobaculia bacterium]|nr:hypothetical protein [Thermoanaerobaculia bacterium]